MKETHVFLPDHLKCKILDSRKGEKMWNWYVLMLTAWLVWWTLAFKLSTVAFHLNDKRSIYNWLHHIVSWTTLFNGDWPTWMLELFKMLKYSINSYCTVWLKAFFSEGCLILVTFSQLNNTGPDDARKLKLYPYHVSAKYMFNCTIRVHPNGKLYRGDVQVTFLVKEGDIKEVCIENKCFCSDKCYIKLINNQRCTFC